MKKRSLLLAAFFLPLAVAGYEGTPIGGEPYASWGEGGNDFVVMFNSLVDDQITLYGEGENRQGDTCILESSFDLTGFHIPDDAVLLEAYAIWMGAVDPAKFAEPTDNQVHLKFVRDDNNYTWEDDIIAGDTPRTLDDTTDPFEFQGVRFESALTTGCSPAGPGTGTTGEVAYFTYRKNITDFFQKIQDDNLASDNPLKDGQALFGKYIVSGLDCTDHDYYRCNNTMVSTWSIIFVYKSGVVRSKKIYLYPGFARAQGEKTTASVSDFTLPKNPVLRITTNIAEGDLALVKPELPPELIYIKGPEAMSTYQLTNTCNPLVDMSFEIYNSISSIIGWGGKDLVCIAGVSSGPDYLGIDNDTFLLDTKQDINLQEHLKSGGTNLDITVSVNQDAVLMNYLVVSVDTKSPMFDIPAEAQINFPYDREKHYCSCRKAEDSEDAYCVTESGGYPMFYLVRVQNWGTDVAQDVMVMDDLDSRVEYIPGTTEMATQFTENGDGTDWVTIPDRVGNGTDSNTMFPLSGTGYKVANQMIPCDQTNWTCADTRLLRFKVKPKKLSKNEVIPNIAIIKEEGSADTYRSNRNFELKLYRGTCQPRTACPEPVKSDCGGDVAYHECDENLPCPEDFICDMDDFICEPDPSKWCVNANVSYDIGANSPNNVDGTIIIPADTTDLIVGQFKLNAENCVQEKFYQFVSLRLEVDKTDAKISVSNVKLIFDKNGNGAIDAEDKVIASVEIPQDSTGVYFLIDPAFAKYLGSEEHFFLVKTDVTYSETNIPTDVSFRFVIETKESFLFEDAGNAASGGESISFAEFQIEPTVNSFIVDRGDNDPLVPSPSEINKDIPILQLRTKSIGLANKVRSITFSATAGEEYASFGDGIKSISLYFDNDGNGVSDGEPIMKISDFSTSLDVTFEGEIIETLLDYEAQEEMFLIVQCEFDLVAGKKAQIEIKKGDITLQMVSSQVEGLPIASKEFYIPEGGIPDDDASQKDGSACSCSMVTETDDFEPTGLLFLVISLILTGLFYSFRRELFF